MARNWFDVTRPGRRSARDTWRPSLEALEDRTVPAVVSAFNAATGLLTVTGDAVANSIAVTTTTAGVILVNGTTASGATVTNARSVVVNAGGGNDLVNLSSLRGFAGTVTIHGDAGNDTLVGSPGNDAMQGNVGHDTMDGRSGNDTMYAYLGNDSLFGGDGNDWMHGDFDRDTVDGGVGDDTLYGGDGTDQMQGHFGNDSMDGGSGTDTMYAYFGNDTMRGGDGADWMHGDFDNDWVDGDGGPDTMFGGDGHDTLRGGYGDDRMDGGTGNDQMYGDWDNDLVDGKEGDDWVYGFTGDDTLLGGPGSDLMGGWEGDDRLYGQGDNDALHGEQGNDGLFGGSGSDTLTGGAGADRFLDYTWTYQPFKVRRWQDVITDGAFTEDQWAVDARVGFENGLKSEWSEGDIKDTYYPGLWEDFEVELVDSALAVLHRATGNTRLLKQADGGTVLFRRYSSITRYSISTDVGGEVAINAGGGVINMPTSAVRSGERWARHIVFHEMGHNWDEEYNPPGTYGGAAWRALSGWTNADMSGSRNYEAIPGPDGKAVHGWYYFASRRGDFVSGYARFNPYEDFADSFDNYFMNLYDQYAGNAPGTSKEQEARDISEIPSKKAFLDNMLRSLN